MTNEQKTFELLSEFGSLFFSARRGRESASFPEEKRQAYANHFRDERRARFFTPPQSSLESRWAQWQQSRLCLDDLLSQLPTSRYADLSLSLSHTPNFSVALLYLPNKGNTPLGVGVDAELAGREMREDLFRKFVRSEEASLGLEALEVWTLKEAAFKADPLTTTGSIIADYQILSFDRKSSARFPSEVEVGGEGSAQNSKGATGLFRLGIFSLWGHKIAWALSPPAPSPKL